MGFNPTQVTINEVIDCKKMAAENFLCILRNKLESTEKVDLFATVNQPLKTKKAKIKESTTMKPKIGTFAQLEDDSDVDPRQKELKEVLKLKDTIEDLEEKMLNLRKKLR